MEKKKIAKSTFIFSEPTVRRASANFQSERMSEQAKFITTALFKVFC